MSELGTFISLFRKFKDWEWYKDVPVKTLFIHCLIKANYKPLSYKGNIVERGSFITSLDSMSKETGLSLQQVRTALKKLKSTQEITLSATKRETLINVINYDKYQSYRYIPNTTRNTNSNILATSQQHLNNISATTSNKDNNTISEINSFIKQDIGTDFEDEILKESPDYKLENCNPIDMFETEFGRTISSSEAMRISQMISDCGQLMVMYALREALTYDALSLDYIDRVLTDWKKRELTTDDYEEGRR